MPMTLFSWVAISLAAGFAALATHEVGHLLAGKLVGFRFGLLAIGPLWILRSVGGVRLRWRWSPKYWGPMAMAFPRNGERVAARVFAYIAGGPAASALLALAAYGVAQSLEIGLGRQLLKTTALVSAAIFVATAQPFFGTGAGVPSDGARLWAYVADPEAAHNRAAAMALDGLARNGMRPRDWDRALIDRACQVTSPPVFALAVNTTLIRRDLDLRDDQSASARIQKLRALITQVPPMFRGAAAAEIAYWMEHFEDDPEGAHRFLAATGVSEIDLEWLLAPRDSPR